MALRKEEGADLRKQYPLYVEIGLVLSLTLLIVAFRADFSNESSFQVQMEEQETVDMKQIQQTQQEKEPPPPPKPPVPQEVPNNEVIENETDFDASLDMDERLDTSQGPPDDGEEEEEEEQEIFMVVENQPKLVGGMRALQQSVEYPEFAKKAGIEGRVIVQFVVDEQGNVKNPKVTRGVHKLLNEEAVKAVKEQSFKPGKQRGQAVKVQMSLPVTFRLQ
ncbi:protein TonB [Salinibacter ruber]|uniref:energy transducer TonB n=1 Tax=Salinibacter ruber TaxID=146919 RepID=UPI00207427F9|nr:energy transducer TonB [Salinibacter ruber]MCS3631254.1 protein TonB [Salinibacter ruber]MCS3829922.1 protein TonB [Salinibacter ruber]MCS4097894.1 protein TonB [Salinibacter ruber]MCS4100954.1 protein TonB [Salinibacter ruber]